LAGGLTKYDNSRSDYILMDRISVGAPPVGARGPEGRAQDPPLQLELLRRYTMHIEFDVKCEAPVALSGSSIKPSALPEVLTWPVRMTLSTS
jgi:hypothetical protein